MKIHICVPIDRALQELSKGNNLFDTDPLTAFSELMKAKEQGKEFYSGCDNMLQSGRCGGHENDKK